MDLFRKKSVDQLVAESTPLKRTMRTFDLTMLGIGAIIGTGIFVLTGKGALTAGPALSVSFLLAAVCCGFAGLCYAEFAAMAPVSGSAYSYAYLAFGELIAFVIGWDLIDDQTEDRTRIPVLAMAEGTIREIGEDEQYFKDVIEYYKSTYDLDVAAIMGVKIG